MERAERVVFLAAGLAIPRALVPVLVALLVLTLVTAAQRFAKIWRQASTEPTPGGSLGATSYGDDSAR